MNKSVEIKEERRKKYQKPIRRCRCGRIIKSKRNKTYCSSKCKAFYESGIDTKGQPIVYPKELF